MKAISNPLTVTLQMFFFLKKKAWKEIGYRLDILCATSRAHI